MGGGGISGRENNKCNGPKVGMCLSRMEANVVRAD